MGTTIRIVKIPAKAKGDFSVGRFWQLTLIPVEFACPLSSPFITSLSSTHPSCDAIRIERYFASFGVANNTVSSTSGIEGRFGFVVYRPFCPVVHILIVIRIWIPGSAGLQTRIGLPMISSVVVTNDPT
jgi:hypothetical protein